MGNPPPPQVTMGDLYREIQAARDEIARVLTRLERTEERHLNTVNRQDDHETRIRALENAIPSSLEVRIMSLEKFRWQVLGALVTIQVLAVLVEYFLLSPKKLCVRRPHGGLPDRRPGP